MRDKEPLDTDKAYGLIAAVILLFTLIYVVYNVDEINEDIQNIKAEFSSLWRE